MADNDSASVGRHGHATPTVSIGLPVFNGARTVGMAIQGIRAQGFRDFELIISDNKSTDGTREICTAAAREDPRIRIIEMPENRGPAANFAAVLAEAQGPYFMFAAADDWMEPNFIEECLARLDPAPHAVACAPRTMIHFADGRSREAWGTSPIGGPSWWRPARFLLRPADNSRFYGLFRTPVMREAYWNAAEDIHGLDWAVSALTLARGAHLRSASVVLHREGAAPHKYRRAHLRASNRLRDRVFPLWRMSADLLRRLTVSQVPLAVAALVVLNLGKSAEYLAQTTLERLHR